MREKLFDTTTKAGLDALKVASRKTSSQNSWSCKRIHKKQNCRKNYDANMNSGNLEKVLIYQDNARNYERF